LAFPNIIDTGLNESQVHQLLLEKAKVAVVPGLSKWFGERAEGHIRLSFATSENILTEALQRIQFTFNEL
jgi:bifunctional pyridoxal-dependent enzyme with beta-cystathionase and maltose regulon repressor activities